MTIPTMAPTPVPASDWVGFVREGYAAFTDAYQKLLEQEGRTPTEDEAVLACSGGCSQYVYGKEDPDLLRMLGAAIEAQISDGVDLLGSIGHETMRETIQYRLVLLLDEEVWNLYDSFSGLHDRNPSQNAGVAP